MLFRSELTDEFSFAGHAAVLDAAADERRVVDRRRAP